MKAISILLINVTLVTFSFAQTKQQSIEESELGWYKVYHYKGAKESKKLDNRIYSIAQLSISDSLANWIQASYIPKGGIGDIKKVIFPKESVYSPYNIGLPQGFGVTSFLWSVEWKNNKIVPVQETEIPWGIAANEVPGMSVNMLSTEKQYYFFMEEGERFLEGTSEEVRKKYEIKTLPQFGKYTTWHLTSSRYDRNAGLVDAVLLCKNNQLPFITVSIGELIQQTGEMIRVKHESEKKKIIEKAQGNQRDIDYFTKYENEKYEKAKVSVTKLLEKYETRLADNAALPSNYDYIDMVNGYDMFTRYKIEESPSSIPKQFPVYKLAASTYELCKKDQPQWILVTWNWITSNASELHMHESIINNFNFDYVNNFFFNPEKVKGQPYKPVHSPFVKEAVVIGEKSESGKKAALDKNVHYFEDFSTTSVGKKPIGWYAKASGTGVSSTVTTIEGASNQWAVIAGNSLIPNNLTKPLPQNFSLSYDLIAPENFTWGGKGLVMQLAKEKTEGVAEAFISLKLRPGSGGSDGEATVETKFPSGYADGTKWYVATGFSNNKKINRIHVTIKKSGEVLQLRIDDKMMAEYAKGIPAGLLFNALSFEMANSDGETQKYYLSNIKITKD